jgi:hypothetical protein
LKLIGIWIDSTATAPSARGCSRSLKIVASISYVDVTSVRRPKRQPPAPMRFSPVDPPGRALARAVDRLVNIRPKERACVLLKDVFDYSLDHIAELVDSALDGSAQSRPCKIG